MTFAWTEEHVTRLREGAAAGKSAGEIAIGLGVTRNTVIGKLRRMKIPLKSDLAQQRRILTLGVSSANLWMAARSTLVRPKRRRPKIVKPVPVLAPVLAPAPKLPDVEQLSPGISLFDIGTNQCRYPLTDAAPLSKFLFCGLPTKDDKCSYCHSHWELCYGKISRNNSEDRRAVLRGQMRKKMIPAEYAGVEAACAEELPVT